MSLDNDAAEAREKCLADWRVAGRAIVTQLGLTLSAARQELRRILREAVVARFTDELPLSRSDEERVQVIADRWLMDSGVASRILRGERGLSLDNACVIAAAEQASFPSSVDVAIQAYQAGLRRVRAWYDSGPAGAEPTAGDILSLHFLVRSPAWQRAALAADKTQLSLAADSIHGQVREYLPHEPVRPWPELASRVRLYGQPWALWEALVTHDWFR